jgi:hypothetical protein
MKNNKSAEKEEGTSLNVKGKDEKNNKLLMTLAVFI